MTDDTSNDTASIFPSAGAVIAAFGGIRPMATRLGVPVSTVQGWKQRGAIPDNRIDEIRAAAQADAIDLAALPAEPAGGDDGAGVDALPHGAHPAGGAASAAAAAPQSPSARAAPRRGSPAMSLAVLALLIAIGAAGWTWWMQQQSVDTGAAAALATLERSLRSEIAGVRSDIVKATARSADSANLAALGERLDAVARKVDGLPAGDADGAALGALARDLEDVRAAVVDNRSAASANTAEMAALRTGIDNTLADLSARLVAVESRDDSAAAKEARAVGLAIAAAEIRRTLRTGAPYAGELATLRALAAGDADLAPALDVLARSADTGLPTAAALARRLDARIGDILAADRTRTGAAWYHQVLGRLGDVVSVRRVGGDAGGDSTDAIVARTEARLADGDLAGAVAEAATLKDDAAAAAAPWLAAAREVLAAEAAVATVNARALATLAAVRGP